MVSDIETDAEVQIIPIAAITVENPRERSEKTFRALVDSIGKVRLKKPITVARDDTASGDAYRLVCGQGRMEAYVVLGETHIPAIVVDANEVERLLRSVIENIARRQQRPLELLQDIAILRDRGYPPCSRPAAGQEGISVDSRTIDPATAAQTRGSDASGDFAPCNRGRALKWSGRRRHFGYREAQNRRRTI